MLIETKRLVTKKYLDSKIKIFQSGIRTVIGRNKKLTKRLAQIVSNQRHYLYVRSIDRKRAQNKNRFKREVALSRFERKLKQKLGNLHVFGVNKNGKKRYLFLVDRSEYARLMRLIRRRPDAK